MLENLFAEGRFLGLNQRMGRSITEYTPLAYLSPIQAPNYVKK